MSGFRRIISVYLTAAVILGLAFSCFGTGSISVFSLPENSGVIKEPVTEEASVSTPPTEYKETESTAEENSSAENNTYSEESTGAQDAETEEKLQQYCGRHRITKGEAIRKGIHLLLDAKK